MGTFTPIVLFWYIFPAIVLFGCNFLVKLFSLDRRFKLKLLILLSLFCGEACMLYHVIWPLFSFLPFFMISMLLMAICIAVFQAYYYDEIIYSRYLKMTWRLAFLLTIVFYGLLIVLNILTYL